MAKKQNLLTMPSFPKGMKRTPEPGKEQFYIEFLIGMAQFARALGLRDVQKPLSELAFALDDLNWGRVAPWLQHAKPKGSPPDSMTIWVKRARVVMAWEALQKSGMTQAKASRYIDSNHPSVRRLMTRGKNLASSIIRWKRELAEAKGGSFLGSVTEQLLAMQDEERKHSKRLSSAADWRKYAEIILQRTDS